MNQKIPIKVLSEQVASRVNIESSDAQDAIKSIFALIADVLKEGKSVTINGLGTFSPDVNPLEPVAFMPDPELADELNAPFSMFEPERLSDSVSEADLNNIGMPEQQPVDSTVSATKVETQSAPSVKVENVPTPEPVKENSGWASSLADKISQEVTDVEVEVEAPVIIQEKTISVPEKEVVAHISTTPPNETPATNGSPETPRTSAPHNFSRKVESTEHIPAPKPVSKTATPPSSRPALEVPEWPEEETTVEERPNYESPTAAEDGSRFKSGFFWGLIVGLLIGALILFGYAMYFSTTV